MTHTRLAGYFRHIDPKQQFWKVFLMALDCISHVYNS